MTGAAQHAIVVAAAAAAGFAAACVVYYPAVMSPDSIGMYAQALSGTIDGGAKTPLVPFVWHLVLKIAPGPFSLVVFQNLLFFTALALIGTPPMLPASASAAVLLGIAFYPAVFALLGTLWNDVFFAACLALFVGVLRIGTWTRSRATIGGAILPLWLAIGSRLNAWPAIVPLTIWWTAAVTANWRPLTRWQLLMTSAGVLVVLSGSSWIAGRAMIDRGSGAAMRALQFSLLHDLAGIASYSGDLRLPVRVRRELPGLTIDDVRAVYDPADVNQLVYNQRWRAESWLTQDAREFEELARVWGGAVLAHPRAYLARRLDALTTIFQIRSSVFYPFHIGISDNDLGLQFGKRPVYEATIRLLDRVAPLFFRGWVFAAIATALVVFGQHRRRWDVVAIAASGLAYTAPYTLITAGSDFRFIWWLVIATLLAIWLATAPSFQDRGA